MDVLVFSCKTTIMKNKRLYLTIAFIFSSVFSFSQVNSYFQNDPQWQIALYAYSGIDCTGSQDFYNYNINGDTVLNSNVFKKVYRKGLYATIDGSCTPGPQSAYS